MVKFNMPVRLGFYNHSEKSKDDPLPMLSRRTLIASSGALFLLGACGQQQNPSASTGGQKIVFWTMQLKPTFDDYMAGLIKDFSKQNPQIAVEWVDVPWADMENKILTSVSAGTAPDVVNLNPQFATKLAEKNALVDMGKTLPKEQQALYFPSIWKSNQLGDAVFGLPWYVGTNITVYNRKLFEKAGIKQAPKNYQELAAASEQLKAKTGKYAFLLTMDGGLVLESMVQMGMPLLGADGKAAFNNPAGKAAFEYWVNLFKKKVIPREILTEGHRKAVELYQAGELAMLLTGPEFIKAIKLNAPDIAKISDVSTQIVGPNGKISASAMNVVVPSSSKNLDSANKFALFLTNAANQLSFSKVANQLPSTVQSAKDPYFTAKSSSSDAETKARVLSASQLAQAEVLVPPVKNVDKLQKFIYDELQQAMLGEKTTDKAMASATEQWNALG
jgi:putative chitobiose transport system substrate-binding protein